MPSFEGPRGSGAGLSLTHHLVHALRAPIARVTVGDEGPESAHLGLQGRLHKEMQVALQAEEGRHIPLSAAYRSAGPCRCTHYPGQLWAAGLQAVEVCCSGSGLRETGL